MRSFTPLLVHQNPKGLNVTSVALLCVSLLKKTKKTLLLPLGQEMEVGPEQTDMYRSVKKAKT